MAVDKNKGAVNKGWIVADVKLDKEHYQDKHLHYVKLMKGGESFEALEISPTSKSGFLDRINMAVDFVIKSTGTPPKLCWITLDEVMPLKYDFKDAAYMARDAVKATVELMAAGSLTFTGVESIETTARSMMDIMLKLAKENSHGD